MLTTRERPSFRPRRGKGFRGLLVAALFFLPGVAAHAQFIRIGPFEFGATAKLDGIYTTNVDGVRPDSTDKEMKDYYATASFDVTSSTALFRNSKLDLSTGLTVERHVKRTDLDTTSDPFGRGRMDTEFQFGRYTLRLNLASETTATESEGIYTPGQSKKTRDINTVTDYGAELEWQRNDLTVIGGYNGSQERHQDEQFKFADQNTYEAYLTTDWKFSKRMAFNYGYRRDKTELLNEPTNAVSGPADSSSDDWNERHTVGLEFEILERPHFTYTLGAEQSSVQGETIDWEPTHTFAIDDQLDFTKTLRLRGNASYKYAQKYAADEIALICDVTLENDISHTARQSLELRKQPAGTFGSTDKTDVTSLDYILQKDDLFIYDLNFTFSASYTKNKPIGSDEAAEPETVKTIEPKLSWDRTISRKITRSLAYLYHWEHSDLLSENLTEHRVTLSYSYTF